jgi:hypothetical protein
MALFEIVDVPIADCDFPVRKLLVYQRVKWDDDSTPGCDIDIVEHPGWPSIPRSIQLWVWSGEIDISDPMWPLWGMEYVFFFYEEYDDIIYLFIYCVLIYYIYTPYMYCWYTWILQTYHCLDASMGWLPICTMRWWSPAACAICNWIDDLYMSYVIQVV